MATRKAQGLPLSFIVIAAISALILVLVIAFTIGGLGGFFRQITIAGGGQDLPVVQTACRTACEQLQARGGLSQTEFESSSYCTRTFSVDLDGDNNIEANITIDGEREVGLRCFYNEVGIPCVVDSLNQPVGQQGSCGTP